MSIKDLIDKLEEFENKDKEVIFNIGKPDKEQPWILRHKIIAIDDVSAVSYYEGDFEYCEISISDEEDEFIETFFS